MAPVLRTYEVMVTEHDKRPKKETVKAFSPQQLVSQYEMMGFEKKQIKILREVGAEQIGEQGPKQPQVHVTNDQGPINMIDTSDLPPEVRAEVEKNLAQQESQPVTQPVQQPVQYVQQPVQQVQAVPPTQKPMLWKDGNTEFKLEAGQLFKKTWNKVGLKKLESDYGIKIRFKNGKDKVAASEYTIEVMEWIRVEQQ